MIVAAAQLGYGTAEDAASTRLVCSSPRCLLLRRQGEPAGKTSALHHHRQTQACTLGDEQAVERQRRGGGKKEKDKKGDGREGG